MADTSQTFAGLPLGLLVCSPIIEVAKGQAELCRVYLDYVFKLAYEAMPETDAATDQVTANAATLTFLLDRQVTDGAGNITQQPIKVVAPRMSLVPIPAFSMQEATVAFTMEVKDAAVDTTDTTKLNSGEHFGSFWGFSASICGSVAAASTHTRRTDHSPKYDITARAAQQAPSEGMARLNQIFASTIEATPIPKCSVNERVL